MTTCLEEGGPDDTCLADSANSKLHFAVLVRACLASVPIQPGCGLCGRWLLASSHQFKYSAWLDAKCTPVGLIASKVGVAPISGHAASHGPGHVAP